MELQVEIRELQVKINKHSTTETTTTPLYLVQAQIRIVADFGSANNFQGRCEGRAGKE